MLPKVLTLTIAGLLFTANVVAAERTGAVRHVEVWSSVLFDTDGKATDYRIVDETNLPPAFADEVKTRLRNARIDPRLVDGKPVTFRTGVRMSFEISPTSGGGSVRMAGLRMAPLPVTIFLASFPADIARTEGWKGSVTARCFVSTQGRCGSSEVTALPGVPESARRFASASMKRWVFEPQLLDGAAIEGEYEITVSLETDVHRVEDFRQDKFERVMRNR